MSRTWVSEPELGDGAIRSATGRGWDEWCDLIDAWSGHHDGHGAVVDHVRSHGIDGWWAQTVAVGWERITGRRLRHQQPDGTFTAAKSRTMAIDAEVLRGMLLDDTDRADLFPGLVTELRSKPTSKSIRVAIDPGAALFALHPLPDGRTRVTVSHERLPTAADVERWKNYWSDWLDAIEQG
jgi:hypothetical protein